MTGVLYLDSSALVKLAVEEPESGALREFVRSAQLVSCDLARVEVPRAVGRHNAAALPAARRVLDAITLIALRRPLLDRAGEVAPELTRSLDAIHLASAESLGSALGTIVTYDRRMMEAAAVLGLTTFAPGEDA